MRRKGKLLTTLVPKFANTITNLMLTAKAVQQHNVTFGPLYRSCPALVTFSRGHVASVAIALLQLTKNGRKMHGGPIRRACGSFMSWRDVGVGDGVLRSPRATARLPLTAETARHYRPDAATGKDGRGRCLRALSPGDPRLF